MVLAAYSRDQMFVADTTTTITFHPWCRSAPTQITTREHPTFDILPQDRAVRARCSMPW